MLQGQTLKPRREGPESSRKRPPGTRIMRLTLGTVETEKDGAKDDAEVESKNLLAAGQEESGFHLVEGVGSRGGCGRGGAGWAVVRKQKTLPSGSTQVECHHRNTWASLVGRRKRGPG